MSLENPKKAAIEDPGAMVVDRLSTFWERYGRVAMGVVAAVAVVIAGAVFMMRARAAAEQQASGKLAEATLLFWQGDYQRSLEQAKQIAVDYGSTPSGRDAHRLAGDDAFWLGDYKTAVESYRRYLATEKREMLADAARRSLAYALENSQQYAEAAKTYESLVGKFDRESSAEFLRAASRCLAAQGQRDAAAKQLQRLLDEYGETSIAGRATAELAALQAPVH